MIQFIYNSLYSYDNFGIIAKTVSRPLLPTKRRSDVVIPGRNGSYDFSDDTYENLIIPVLIQCESETFEDLRTRARNISAWLGQTTFKPLIFTDEPDKYYLAKIYDSASLGKIVELVPGESVTVNFECYPLAYSIEPDVYIERLILGQTIEIQGTYKVSPIITLSPVVLSGGMEEAIENTGTFNPEATPYVTTITNPTLTIGNNTLVYDGTLVDGESLIINTETFQVTKGGVNVLSKISGDWPFIEVGSNVISATDTTSWCGVNVEIVYRKRWL